MKIRLETVEKGRQNGRGWAGTIFGVVKHLHVWVYFEMIVLVKIITNNNSLVAN